MQYDFEKLLEAFEHTSFGGPDMVEAWLNRETGDVLLIGLADEIDPVPEDFYDREDKFLCLPDKRALDLGKPLALDFANQFLPQQAEQVDDIFHRRGAYSNFKNLLEQHDKLQQWYDVENQQQRQALREWCEQEGLSLIEPESPKE